MGSARLYNYDGVWDDYSDPTVISCEISSSALDLHSVRLAIGWDVAASRDYEQRNAFDDGIRALEDCDNEQE